MKFCEKYVGGLVQKCYEGFTRSGNLNRSVIVAGGNGELRMAVEQQLFSLLPGNFVYTSDECGNTQENYVFNIDNYVSSESRILIGS